jgi:hypothetical protein
MPEGEDRRTSRVSQSPEVRHYFFTSSLPNGRGFELAACSFQNQAVPRSTAAVMVFLLSRIY